MTLRTLAQRGYGPASLLDPPEECACGVAGTDVVGGVCRECRKEAEEYDERQEAAGEDER